MLKKQLLIIFMLLFTMISGCIYENEIKLKNTNAEKLFVNVLKDIKKEGFIQNRNFIISFLNSDENKKYITFYISTIDRHKISQNNLRDPNDTDGPVRSLQVHFIQQGKNTIIKSNGLDTDFTQGTITYVPAFELIEKRIKWHADFLNKALLQ